MGYPSGITSFTNKNPGDTILDTHIDDLQTEVTAIETDLINGLTGKLTANNGFQSSKSTVANLHATGDSTFVSSSLTISTQTYVFPSSRASTGDVLTVASTSGSTATLQWRPGVTRPTCLLRHGAVTEIPANTFTALDWNTEDADAQGMHDTASNSSRITFAHSTGLYAVGLNVMFGNGAGSTGFVTASIRRNDTLGLVGQEAMAPTAGSYQPVTVTTLLDVTSTADYVTAMVFGSVGSTNRIQDSTASTVAGSPRFWAHKVG